MADPLPDRAVKGRGAVGNPTGRFEVETRWRIDDGWTTGSPDGDDPPGGPPTTLSVDRARRIIARNDSPDVPFDRSINPYRGCEHGCVYCFARPSHAYLGLSPGRDFETRLFHKPDAPALLARELSRPGYRPATLALGANTDPYQPVERRTGLTRRLLGVLADFRHPVGLITKSDLVLRDLDILGPMGRAGLASLCVSLTTLDGALARRMEPRAAAPGRRLKAIEGAAAAGLPVAVLTSPMIPGLNDWELERLLATAAAAGATSANYIVLRLPHELGDLFEDWLAAHYPDRAAKVMNTVRRMRGGSRYDASFGRRMTGEGIEARLLADRFAAACRRHHLGRRGFRLDASQFRVPPRPGDQLSLL